MWQEAGRNLIAHRIRSFLAMIGIVIGSGAMVVLLSLGLLAKAKALAEFDRLGTDLIAINVNADNLEALQTLEITQWQAVASQIPAVIRLAPYGYIGAPVRFQARPLPDSYALMTDPALFALLKTPLLTGRLMHVLDHDRNYGVIGHALAVDISVKPQQAVGQVLQLGNVYVTVVGVLAPTNNNPFFEGDINRSVFLSYAAARKLPFYMVLNNALLQLPPHTDMRPYPHLLGRALQAWNPHLAVTVRTAQAVQDSLSHQQHTLTIWLSWMVGVLLLVGGTGIMNIMLVSVSERQTEIGLRLAIGAKQRHIRYLFLTEAFILGLLGGLIGSVLGESAVIMVSSALQWPYHFYSQPIALAIGLALTTSVLFGFYPAYQASRLNPITVLRRE